MSIKVVSTEDFWAAMCDPRFIRTGKLEGRMAGDLYVTACAPEDIPGFIDRITEATSRLWRSES